MSMRVILTETQYRFIVEQIIAEASIEDFVSKYSVPQEVVQLISRFPAKLGTIYADWVVRLVWAKYLEDMGDIYHIPLEKYTVPNEFPTQKQSYFNVFKRLWKDKRNDPALYNYFPFIFKQGEKPNEAVIEQFYNDWITKDFRAYYRNMAAPLMDKLTAISDWVDSPLRPTGQQINLRQLGFEAAARQAEQWHEEIGQHAGRRIEDVDGEVVIKYPNGFYWIRLENCSREEAEAMGHCGTGHGDNLYSLRKDGYPFVTVDVKDDAIIESKGRANTKPHQKYHQYILDFIEKMNINHIIRSGYKPELNFALSDLAQVPMNLIYQRPGLVDDRTYATMVKNGTMTPELEDKLLKSGNIAVLVAALKKNPPVDPRTVDMSKVAPVSVDGKTVYNEWTFDKNTGAMFVVFKDIDEFVDKFGSDAVRTWNYIQNGEMYDYYNNSGEDVAYGLTREAEAVLEQWIEDNGYSEEFEEYNEDLGEWLDNTSAPVADEIKYLYNDMHHTSMNENAYKQFMDSIESETEGSVEYLSNGNVRLSVLPRQWADSLLKAYEWLLGDHDGDMRAAFDEQMDEDNFEEASFDDRDFDGYGDVDSKEFSQQVIEMLSPPAENAG